MNRGPVQGLQAAGNNRVTSDRLFGFFSCVKVRAMKIKSNKANWATVLCAAAVLSVIGLRDAEALGLPGAIIMPPPPISGTSDGPVQNGSILPPPPINDDLTAGEQLSGDFNGTLMFD
jgi:hypothetical protein